MKNNTENKNNSKKKHTHNTYSAECVVPSLVGCFVHSVVALCFLHKNLGLVCFVFLLDFFQKGNLSHSPPPPRKKKTSFGDMFLSPLFWYLFMLLSLLLWSLLNLYLFLVLDTFFNFLVVCLFFEFVFCSVFWFLVWVASFLRSSLGYFAFWFLLFCRLLWLRLFFSLASLCCSCSFCASNFVVDYWCWWFLFVVTLSCFVLCLLDVLSCTFNWCCLCGVILLLLLLLSFFSFFLFSCLLSCGSFSVFACVFFPLFWLFFWF